MPYPPTTVVQLMLQQLKSRYQKQIRNATFSLIRLLFIAAWIGLTFTCHPAASKAAPPLAERSNREANIAAAAGVQATVPVFYLIPDTSSAVQLQTHTADFRVVDGQESGITAAYAGRYRLKNEGEEALSVPMLLVAGSPETPQDVTVSVSADGFPLTLESADGGLRTQAEIAPDASLDIRVDYTAQIEDASLALLRYDARRLAAWPGAPGLRTTIVLPNSIVPESWVNVEPEGWTYATTVEAGEVGIQWLYDGVRPTAPFVLRFVMPDEWRRLDAEARAKESGDPAAFLALGNGYRSLYLGLPVDDDNDTEVKERFYAQALGAYTAGLERVEAGSVDGVVDGAEAGALHAGLASLYRSRALTVGGAVDSGYTALMVRAATAALAAMPADDARRFELTQWQADGLRQLLAEAQRRGDWGLVSALLDQMSALPEPPLSPDALAEERRAATVLQALSLLESGQREAAMALAGPQVVDAELQPPSDLQRLFYSWQITDTLSPKTIDLDIQARSTAERAEAARLAFQGQIEAWKDLSTLNEASFQFAESSLPDGGSVFRLNLSLDDRNAALTLAQLMVPGPDWALLRTVLEQIAPLVRTENRTLQRTISIEQSLDLRAAQAQWQAMADSLADQALDLEAERRGVNPNNAEEVEDALRARIRASNYRSAAEAWRTLAGNSWVMTRLTTSEGDGGSMRTWLATTSMPAETYYLQSEAVRSARLLWITVAILAGLFVISGLLWRLL